jgi:hypothetical protein
MRGGVMIEVSNTLIKGEWWVIPIGRNAFGEPHSTYPLNKSVFDLEKELPPLLYGRYCMLRIAKHMEQYEGLGVVYKYADGEPYKFYICEEE